MRVVAQVVGTPQTKTVDVAVRQAGSATPPAGYTLIENKTFTTNPRLTSQSKIAYRNCKFPGGLNIEDGAHHIWLDHCELGGLWLFGPCHDIELHWCSWGGSAQDGSQIWSKAVGGVAPSNILMEDCYIHDVTMVAGDHPDGLQVGGVSNLTMRRCKTKNVAVQVVFLNAWTANIDTVLIENCEFERPTNGGYYTVIIGAGDAPYQGKNITVRNNKLGAPINFGVGNTSAGRADDPKRNNVSTGNVIDPGLKVTWTP